MMIHPPFATPWARQSKDVNVICKTWVFFSFELKCTKYIIFSFPEFQLGPPSWGNFTPLCDPMDTRRCTEIICRTWFFFSFEIRCTKYMIFSFLEFHLYDPQLRPPPFAIPCTRRCQEIICQMYFFFSFEMKCTKYMIISFPDFQLWPPSWGTFTPLFNPLDTPRPWNYL